MKILLTNNKLNTFGGSENWVLTMSQGLRSRGFEVQVFSNEYGRIWEHIRKTGATKVKDSKFDLVLYNHTTCIDKINHYIEAPVFIQNIHSKFIDIERPHPGIKNYVAISHEIGEEFNIENVIYNPVNNDVFKDRKQKRRGILCLSQGKEAQKVVSNLGKVWDMPVYVHTKWHKPLTQSQLADKMNDVEYVIGAGRGIMEGLTAGCKAIIYDSRGYDKQNNCIPVNYLTFNDRFYHNFTGRGNNVNHNLKDILPLATFPYYLPQLNYQFIIDQYLKLWKKLR